MWNCIRRFFKSVLGSLVNNAENPVTILKQNIRELREKKIKYNKRLADARGRKGKAKREVKKFKDRVDKIEKLIKRAINKKKDEKAKELAKNLQDNETKLEKAEENYNQLKKIMNKLEENKKVFDREIDEKIREAKNAIQEHKLSETFGEVANTMESFEIGGVDQTHEVVINRLEKDSVKTQTQMEIALESSEDENRSLPSTKEFEAEETLKKFKKEMESGEVKKIESEKVENNYDDEDNSSKEVDVEKTIGKIFE